MLNINIKDYLSSEQMKIIEETLKNKYNILICGGTGAGKTVFLNALVNHISLIIPNNIIAVIENVEELTTNPNITIKRFKNLKDINYIEEIKNFSQVKIDNIIIGEIKTLQISKILKICKEKDYQIISTIHESAFSYINKKDIELIIHIEKRKVIKLERLGK